MSVWEPTAESGPRPLLMRAFTAAPFAVAVTRGPEHVVEYVNPAYTDMFGPRQVGQTGREAFPELMEQGFLDLMNHVLTTGEAYQVAEAPVWYTRPGEATLGEHFLTCSYSAIPTGEGEPYGVLMVAVDVTDQVRARREVERQRERLALLARASVRLVTSLDLDETLQAIAEAVVPAVARLCVIDLVEGERLSRHLVYYPDAPEAVRDLLERVGPAENPAHPANRAWRAAAPVVIDRVSNEDVAGMYLTPETRAMAAEVYQGHGLAAVPLVRQGEVLGVVSMKIPAAGGAFPAVDMGLLEQLAIPAAEAIDNAQRFGEERRTALALQHALLSAPPAPGWVEIAARYRPATRAAGVGGDWFDAFVLPGGDVALVVGDVMGHDVRAAGTMGQIRSMVRALACDTGDPPEQVLRRLDALNEWLDVTDFTTLVLARVTPLGSGVRLRWANAGHPPPLVVHPDGTGRVLDAGAGVVLGAGPAVARTGSVEKLLAGTTLLLYTDGLVEDRAESVSEGIMALLDHATRAAKASLPEFCAHVFDHYATAGADDVAILAVRVPG